LGTRVIWEWHAVGSRPSGEARGDRKARQDGWRVGLVVGAGLEYGTGIAVQAAWSCG